jgi:hypothetical protein
MERELHANRLWRLSVLYFLAVSARLNSPAVIGCSFYTRRQDCV